MTPWTVVNSEAEGRLLAMTSDQYVVSDGILYHLSCNKMLHLVPPTKDRKKLCLEAHRGRFGAHLGDVQYMKCLPNTIGGHR